MPVNLFSNVLFPTEGNPISPTRASPVFETSNPSPPPPPPLLVPPSISCALSLANLAFSMPRWALVALFF